MAKKSKRQKTYSRGAGSNSRSASAMTDRAGANVSAASGRNDFDPDYSHVKKDLTRIASLAGFFFVALIVLSFFMK